MKNYQVEKGFTLIELLVVIAIIGILASIVMSQVNVGRAKAANAAVKASLSGLRTEAANVYEEASPNSYDGVCTSDKFVESLTNVGIHGGAPAECFEADDTWVVKATLILAEDTNTSWCADFTGKSKGITDVEYAAITSATTLCP